MERVFTNHKGLGLHQVFFNGLAFGLLVAFSFGPVFFAIMQTSIRLGFRSALYIAIGVALSDAAFAGAAHLGLSSLLDESSFRMWLGYIGGLILVVYGVYNWFKKTGFQKTNEIEPSGSGNFFKQIVKGFILNGINPFIIIFWIGILSVASVNYQYDPFEQRLFILGMLITIFSFDLIKASLARRLLKWVNPQRMRLVNRIIGLLLGIFGLRMIYYAIFDYEKELVKAFELMSSLGQGLL